MMGRKTRLFPSFNLALEAFVETPKIPGQGLYGELLTDTGKFRSAALGAESGGLVVRRLCPLAVLPAHISGRVLFEHDNVLVGDGLGGDFRHDRESFNEEGGFGGRRCSI